MCEIAGHLRFVRWSMAWALAVGLCAAAAADLPPVDRFTLDNGLEVWHVHRAETASVALGLVVRVGSRYEEEDQRGISHMVEHYCFEGTDRYSGEAEMIEIISSQGGVWNAHTAEERTTYFAILPDTAFETAAEWIAQLVFQPTLPAGSIERVRNVIQAEKGGKTKWYERHGFGADVDGAVREALFPDSSLAPNVIGEDKTIESISYDQVRAYYQKHYMPNNAVLIVVGNVDRPRLTAALKAQFAPVARGYRPEPPSTPALPEGPLDRVVLRGITGFRQGTVLVGVRTPASADADWAAIRVLTELFQLNMTRELQFQRGLAYRIFAYGEYFHDTGYLTLFTQAKRSNLREVEQYVFGEIDNLRDGKVDAARLEAAKTSLRGRWALSTEGNMGYLNWLESLTFDYAPGDALPDVPEAIAAVTPQDITRIVQAHFTPDRMCTAIHKPLL